MTTHRALVRLTGHNGNVSVSVAVIRDRIRLLAAIDPDRHVFGAGTHQYQLAPPLTDAELVTLEAGVGPLPTEYRTFVRTLGAHGAGPYYGLVELRRPDDPLHTAQPDPSRGF